MEASLGAFTGGFSFSPYLMGSDEMDGFSNNAHSVAFFDVEN
jgi:hypothetical protein